MYLISLVGTLFISCKGSNNSTADVPKSFDSEVMFANAKQLENLITPQDIAEITGIEVKKISAYQENFEDTATTQFLLFSWENGETILAGDQEIKARSSIGFGRIQKMSLAEFDAAFQQKTAAQVKAEIEQMTTNESIDPDVAIWNAKEIAKIAKSQTFEKLANVGNAAVWESPINVLHVYVNDFAFSISANYGDDEKINKEKAISLAQFIFNKTSAN